MRTRQPFTDRPDVELVQPDYTRVWYVHLDSDPIGRVEPRPGRRWDAYYSAARIGSHDHPTLTAAAAHVVEAHERRRRAPRVTTPATER